MRVIKLLIFLLSVTFWVNSFGVDNTLKIDSVFRVFKIMKIQKVKNGFIIDLHDEVNDKWYTLVSQKERIRSCKKIKVGKSYTMYIFPFFKNTQMPNLGFVFEVFLNGNKILVPSRSWTGNVYTTPNLIGLCYISNEK